MQSITSTNEQPKEQIKSVACNIHGTSVNLDFPEFGESTSSRQDAVSYASKLIDDLVTLRKWSLSRIARRINVSVSTIQKLYQKKTIQPRFSTFNKLLLLHHRIFYIEVNTTE